MVILGRSGKIESEENSRFSLTLTLSRREKELNPGRYEFSELAL